jgi:segregation and condensation protein B
MTDSESLAKTDLASCLEAVLFVASGPVTMAQLAATLAVSTQDIENALNMLSERCALSGGLSLQWHAGKVQLTTSSQMGPLIERFLGLENSTRLSKAALETLAVICYQQPATRPQIDSIRGVSSDGVIKSLLSKGLIQEVGRAEGPGRPIMYATTADFLQNFGLNSIKELPPLEEMPGNIGTMVKDQKILKD